MASKTNPKHGDKVTFDLSIGIGDLIEMEDINGMNELADDKNPYEGMMLTDIGYAVVGFKKGEEGCSKINGEVIVRVTAILESIDEE